MVAKIRGVGVPATSSTKYVPGASVPRRGVALGSARGGVVGGTVTVGDGWSAGVRIVVAGRHDGDNTSVTTAAATPSAATSITRRRSDRADIVRLQSDQVIDVEQKRVCIVEPCVATRQVPTSEVGGHCGVQVGSVATQSFFEVIDHDRPPSLLAAR